MAGDNLYTHFTRPFPLLQKWVWLAGLARDLGANQNISATAPVEILNILWSMHISQKVIQAQYLQYQTYCILVEHNFYIYHNYHTTAYI